MSSNVIIIPTLNPDEKLIELVKLLKENFKNIIIVNDGSSKESVEIFRKLQKLNCIIETHSINRGKGEAIKTGIKKALTIKEGNGFITADSDGQHTQDDILRLSKELDENPNIIIFGVRNFKNQIVPIKSKIGNTFSSIYYYIITHKKCPDTQTGLRAIPFRYAPLALETDGTRYEYEMNFLLNITKQNIKIKYIPIKTIYENNNKSSHFRIIKDSYIIYKELFIFIFVSIISAIIDITGFYLLTNIKISILLSTIVARTISGIINFTLNKILTFKTKKNIAKESLAYLILFLCQMLLSGILVNIISVLSFNIIYSKICIDIILFITSYIIQLKYIFKK